MQTGAQGGGLGGMGTAMAPIKIGGREISVQKVVSQLNRTFFCLGPVCLRSGIGPGVGVGCGVGVIKGPMIPVGGAAGNMEFLRQLPGGYQMMNVLRTVMRKFPGSKTGVGCGVGAGFGFGIGIGPAGSGTGGTMMGGGMMGGTGMGKTGMDGGGDGTGVGSGGTGGKIGTKKLEERIDGLEEKLMRLEERVGVSLKLKELEERVRDMEKGRRRRG